MLFPDPDRSQTATDLPSGIESVVLLRIWVSGVERGSGLSLPTKYHPQPALAREITWVSGAEGVAEPELLP